MEDQVALQAVAISLCLPITFGSLITIKHRRAGNFQLAQKSMRVVFASLVVSGFLLASSLQMDFKHDLTMKSNYYEKKYKGSLAQLKPQDL